MRNPRSHRGIARFAWLATAIAMIVMTLAPITAVAHTEADPMVVRILAGRSDSVGVGDALVWNDGENLYVDFAIDTGLDDAWCITQTHVAVGTSVADIPQTMKSNPIPGQFEYAAAHDCVTWYREVIPLGSWGVGTDLVIAAHADVETLGGVGGLNLPDRVTMKVDWPGGDSYFNMTVAGGTVLDGVHDAFCIDSEHRIEFGQWYDADVYSSYEPLPPGTVAYPENLDLVNWIVNQGFVGTASPGGHGIYTYGDVQRAIWVLVEDRLTEFGLGPWSQDRVDEIVAAAYAAGEGYVPGCGDYLAVVIDPDGFAQITILLIPLPCGRGESAWAEGMDFAGPNWAMYFNYAVQ
jgi:hypothetical protein